MSFEIFYNENSFLAYKNKKLKKSKNWHFYKGVNSWFFSQKSKNWHFSRGVNPWFSSKNCHFFQLFFRQYRQGKWLSKQEDKKSRKIDSFTKGLIHGFCPKMIIIPTWFLRQYRQGQCLSRYSRTKKLLSRLWKQEVQKVEKLTFFQRG